MGLSGSIMSIDHLISCIFAAHMDMAGMAWETWRDYGFTISIWNEDSCQRSPWIHSSHADPTQLTQNIQTDSTKACRQKTLVQIVREHRLWDVQEHPKVVQFWGGFCMPWWAQSLSPVGFFEVRLAPATINPGTLCATTNKTGRKVVFVGVTLHVVIASSTPSLQNRSNLWPVDELRVNLTRQCSNPTAACLKNHSKIRFPLYLYVRTYMYPYFFCQVALVKGIPQGFERYRAILLERCIDMQRCIEMHSLHYDNFITRICRLGLLLKQR